MATARAAGSRGGTSRPASAGSPARISRAPPASVPTAGVPEARASTSTSPHGSGSVEGYTRQSRSAMRSPATGPGNGPSQCTPSSRALAANDSAYSSLSATVPPATTTSVCTCACAWPRPAASSCSPGVAAAISHIARRCRHSSHATARRCRSSRPPSRPSRRMLCGNGAKRWGSRRLSVPAAGFFHKRSKRRRCCARGCGGWIQ